MIFSLLRFLKMMIKCGTDSATKLIQKTRLIFLKSSKKEVFYYFLSHFTVKNAFLLRGLSRTKKRLSQKANVDFKAKFYSDW